MYHKPPTKKSQEKLIEKFNRAFSIGDKINVRQDDGQVLEWTVRAPASLLGGHTAVIWCNEHSSCYMADRVSF